MGLDTTHDCWHGSYSGFAEFRNELAVSMGLALQHRTDDGWERDTYWPAMIEALGFVPTHNMISGWWENEEYQLDEDQGLYYLLIHSDCDGYLMETAVYELHDAMVAHRETFVTSVRARLGSVTAHYHICHYDEFIAGLARAKDDEISVVGFH